MVILLSLLNFKQSTRLTQIFSFPVGLIEHQYDNEDVKREILVTLTNAIEGHSKNKDLLIENEGFEDVIACLECDSSISETAVQLLYELLVERSCWNVSYCRKISQKYGAINGLVKLHNRRVIESSDKAAEILMNLCEGDEHSIIKIVEAGCFEPLAKRAIEENKRRFINTELRTHVDSVVREAEYLEHLHQLKPPIPCLLWYLGQYKMNMKTRAWRRSRVKIFWHCHKW